MENFAINIRNYQRANSLFPPLLSLVHSQTNPPVAKEQLRTTINFGLILSAPFTEAKYEMDGKMYTATVPSFSYIQPGWKCRQANPGNCEKLYFIYDKKYLPHFDFFTNNPEMIMQPLEINRRIRNILDEISLLAPHHEQFGNIDRLDYLCAQLVTEFMISTKNRIISHDPTSRRLREVAEYFNSHFNESIDLQKLISRTGMSERTFNRRWKENFELPPHAYILNRRINMACCLLLETDLKIYQIAHQTGFDDQYYFSRIFKKNTSYSPKEYRQTH